MVQRIFGRRYELLELIGGGGMADVYRAHDKLLDRSVAVKILHPQFSNDAEFIEKFHREAQGAAKLSHPNIVNIYDVGEEAGSHYIVMEYVAGDTLKNEIQQQGHLPVAESLDIARQIAEALEHAHQNNLVHCDIKPHNILMMRDGRVKVADFGIARAVTASTMTYSGNVIGSVHYFSPEQAKGTVVTPKSDVYSLGIVLYEMLTGKLPFTGETSVGIALKHLQEEAVPVRQVDPTIPTIVEAVVSKLMAKDPAMRPDSSEVVREISQAQAMLQYPGAMQAAAPDPYATQVLPRVSAQPGAYASRRRAPEPEEEEETSVFKSKKFIFGLVMILVLGFFAGAFMSYGKFWSNAEVAVPNVVGQTMAVAKQNLEDKKLRVNVAETYDTNTPAGQVVSQTPEAGTKVKEERLVTIYVSKGGEEVEMPDLKGLSRSDAEAKLKKLGLKVGTISEKYSSEEAGTIVSQDPRAGSKISKGQSVDLVISKGEKKKTALVPEVSGTNADNAKSALTSRGFKVNVTKQASAEPAGTVISQSPASGSEQTEGSTVEIVVSDGSKVQNKTNNKQSTDAAENSSKTPSKKNESGKTDK